ncbi:MAG: hypothetical protein Q7W13_00235 [Bacteroidia bacterium]|nr:hypothetical protein [Bacteroidia bacterium]
MKTSLILIAIIGGSFLCSPVFSQEKETHDSLGLPGDNLNLYGVLDLFQKSETLEEFEEKLNAEDSKINNLDLNGNNKIDYISVKDNMKGNAHAIVLQVAINEKETQDIAVIEVEKDNNDKVRVQVVGDEQLYGKNYIVEPKDASSKDNNTQGGTPNPGYSGKTTAITNNYYTTNNNNGGNYGGYGYPADNWSIIRYMYYPSYFAYVSPWHWGYYPGHWNSWAPLFWHSYYSYNYYHHPDYYGNYCRSNMYRNTNAHSYYEQRRSTSVSVNQRREKGAYNNTYSRRDLASKEGKEGRSPQGNRISNSSFGNTRTNRAGSRNATVNERNVSSENNRGNRAGNKISDSNFGNTRTNTNRADSRNAAVNDRNVSSGNNNNNNNNNNRNKSENSISNSNYQNTRTNRADSRNGAVNDRNASQGNNNRGNRATENRGNRINYSERQNGNSSSRNNTYSASPSRSYSAPKSGSYSTPRSGSNSSPSHSSGGGGRSSSGGGSHGGGGGRHR